MVVVSITTTLFHVTKNDHVPKYLCSNVNTQRTRADHNRSPDLKIVVFLNHHSKLEIYDCEFASILKLSGPSLSTNFLCDLFGIDYEL